MIADFEMVIPSPRGAATEDFIKLAARQHYAAWVGTRPRRERSELRELGTMWNKIASQFVPSHLETEQRLFHLNRDVAKMTAVLDRNGRHVNCVSRCANLGQSLTDRVAKGFIEVAAAWPSESVLRTQQSRVDAGLRYRSLVVWSNGVKAAERQCGLR